MAFDLSKFKKKKGDKKEEDKKGKKKFTSPSKNFMKRFEAAK